ncbi:hypothetical protein DPMN_140373 [Dreissena polymorpha]|uniref:Uncharacterized protein n=1 Tax=Dreissena polymorpha TaxID=45954 RepID=A0A9D4JHC3_DREPO|nr:hypothetical protein DPMN_140373 [Dreissena polymorpha]
MTLHHGDRVILGGDHYFRFNHPIEVQQTRKSRNGVHTQESKDFEFAKAELMRVQEARLQEARQAAQEEMLEEVEQAKREAELRLADLEKVMREETEGKVKEAEDVISKLKKQKMILEQEVIAGRKRQQLEAEAALKAYVSGKFSQSEPHLSVERSRLLELLQEQREEAKRKLDSLRQRRKEAASQTPRAPAPSILEVSTGKMDLYKIALQIREANKISQYLKKNTVFSREDYLDGEEVHTLNVNTHWSLGKFEEKLIQMRDLYQLQYQSPGIGHDRDRTMLSLLDSRSTSDHMATPVSRSLPDGIGQGHRPMPDHLASAIRSLSGDNTDHDMTGTSPGTLITDH